VKPTCRDRSTDAVDPQETSAALGLLLRTPGQWLSRQSRFPDFIGGLALGKAMRRLYLIKLIGGPAAWLLVARAQQPAAPGG
jgi:hypothetical protein